MTQDVPAGGKTRWWSDLALGVRLAVKGGRSGWGRLALISIGVGVGVAVLLLAGSIPQMLDARDERGAAVTPVFAGKSDDPPDDALLMKSDTTVFRGDVVEGNLVQATSHDSPTPPGVDSVPQPGEMYASPALADILESADGALLSPRVDYDLAGVITSEGLTDPGELLYYAGSDELDHNDQALLSFGVDPPSSDSPLSTEVLLLLVVGIVVLILPVVMYVAVAMRFGSEHRDRRLAALRLMGLSRTAVVRVAAGEALVGAVLGLMAGAALFLLGRQLAEYVSVLGIGVFSSDVVPAASLAAIVALGVPLLSTLVTALSMRRVVMEPLGVVRQVTPIRRRLWWRLILFVPGAALLGYLAVNGFEPVYRSLAVVATMGVLLGMAMLLPFGVDVVVRRMRGGGALPWQLAARRLQLSGGGMARVVNGIAVAVAGGIALQLLLAGVSADMFTGDRGDESRATVSADSEQVGVDEFVDRVDGATGVDVTDAHRTIEVLPVDGEDSYIVVIADCEHLNSIATLSSCEPGEAFYTSHSEAEEGTRVEILERHSAVPGADPATQSWTTPESSEAVDLEASGGVEEFLDVFGDSIAMLVTPEVMSQDGMQASNIYLGVDLDSNVADAPESLRNAVEPAPVEGAVLDYHRSGIDVDFVSVQLGLTLGVIVLMVLTGLSLLVSTVEQLQERRRVLSVLRAFGARRRTLVWSLVWQAAIPVFFGLAVAAVIGSILGMALLLTGGMSMVAAFDWTVVVGITGISAAVMMLISLAGTPVLWRLMKSDGLRTE